MKYYLGPVLWMGIIFLFSTDAGSATHTNAVLAPVIKFFAPEISRKNLVITLITIRKIAHVVEYAILSILWLYALQQGRPGWSWQAAFGALAISSLYAGLDEFHQSFVLTRTASLQDVGIDSFGAILGQGIWCLLRSRLLSTIQAKFFGWWFAWGVFSTIMVLIVLKGGALSFGKMLLIILSVGVLSGAAGLVYYARHR